MVLAYPKDHVRADRCTKAFRDVREHHKIKMSRLLEEYNWSFVLSTQCIREKVQNFQFALMQMYNDCFPVKTVLMSSRDPPFMSPLVKHLLKRRQAILRKGGQKQNPNVTILQERINKLIRENQLQAVKHDSNKHDKGTISWWSTINSITGRKSICQSISSIIDPASINEYFGVINTDPDYSPPEMFNIPEGTRIPSFTVHEVRQALMNINRTTSGPDDFPYWLFRDFGYYLTPVITDVFKRLSL